MFDSSEISTVLNARRFRCRTPGDVDVERSEVLTLNARIFRRRTLGDFDVEPSEISTMSNAQRLGQFYSENGCVNKTRKDPLAFTPENCDSDPRSMISTKISSVPVDFLRPKFRVAHTKDDVISIKLNKYTYTNMYIIKKIISCRFILCWDITSLFKPYEKSCRRLKVKIEKILRVTYRTLPAKTTNFRKSGGYKICLYLMIISYST